jgi:hypothetical protein
MIIGQMLVSQFAGNVGKQTTQAVDNVLVLSSPLMGAFVLPYSWSSLSFWGSQLSGSFH